MPEAGGKLGQIERDSGDDIDCSIAGIFLILLEEAPSLDLGGFSRQRS